MQFHSYRMFYCVYYFPFRYAKMNFDKYIKTQKTMDKYVNGIVGQKKSLIFIGSASFSPSSPIKGHVKCPGSQRLKKYFKKKKDCVVIDVDEYNTSRVCGKCHKRFEQRNQGKSRQRICMRCNPDNEMMPPADVVYTKTNIRELKKQRSAMNNEHVSKWSRIVMNNTFDHGTNMSNTLWDRDISAARAILYKGTI